MNDETHSAIAKLIGSIFGAFFTAGVLLVVFPGWSNLQVGILAAFIISAHA